MINKKIAIIGCGNLGSSIAEGLLRKINNPANLIVTRRNLDLIQHFSEKGVTITSDNKWAVKESQIILVALKPFKLIQILDEIEDSLTPDHIVVSMATGVGLNEIEKHTGTCKNVYRAMPNVAASVGQSATCISKNQSSPESMKQVHSLFDLMGSTLVINEELMESATVIGACGTAFALRFIRAMVQAGIQIGFSSKTATKIANQTVKGAAEILIQSGNHPEAEIDKVTTPKGITITGLNEMEHQGFSASLIQGILASYRKIEGL